MILGSRAPIPSVRPRAALSAMSACWTFQLGLMMLNAPPLSCRLSPTSNHKVRAPTSARPRSEPRLSTTQATVPTHSSGTSSNM